MFSLSRFTIRNFSRSYRGIRRINVYRKNIDMRLLFLSLILTSLTSGTANANQGTNLIRCRLETSNLADHTEIPISFVLNLKTKQADLQFSHHALHALPLQVRANVNPPFETHYFYDARELGEVDGGLQFITKTPLTEAEEHFQLRASYSTFHGGNEWGGGDWEGRTANYECTT